MWLFRIINSCSTTEDDLELLFIILLPAECWDYGHGSPPSFTYAVVRNEPRVSCMVGKHSTNEVKSSAPEINKN